MKASESQLANVEQYLGVNLLINYNSLTTYNKQLDVYEQLN